MPLTVFTIGHSTHPPDRFLALLTQHAIEMVVDIRRFPGSRKFPYFRREELASALRKVHIEYHWLEALGGRRHKQKTAAPSTNLGLRNRSFRNYADYMNDDAFREGVEKLLQMARHKRTAIMCAEGLYWRCHRRLVSDFLTANAVTVQHIMPNGELSSHRLTSAAVVESGCVTYPPEGSESPIAPHRLRA